MKIQLKEFDWNNIKKVHKVINVYTVLLLIASIAILISNRQGYTILLEITGFTILIINLLLTYSRIDFQEKYTWKKIQKRKEDLKDQK